MLARGADPAATAAHVKIYNEERRRLAHSAGDQIAKLTRRVGEIACELDRLIDPVTQGVAMATLAPRIKALEAERDDVTTKLAQASRDVEAVTLHPATIEQYRVDVARLADLEQSDRLIATVRRLVESVVVYAASNRRGFTIEVCGRPAQLINSATF